MEDGPYLLELVRYIHLNPLRARLVGNLRELERYRWSGHAVLTGEREAPWQDSEQVLLQFGETRGRAVRAYRDFVAEGVEQGKRLELTGRGGIGRTGMAAGEQELEAGSERRSGSQGVLGSSGFASEVCKQSERRAQRRLVADEARAALEAVLAKVCRKHGVRAEEVRGFGREREVTRARAHLAYEAVRRRGVPAIAVASFLSVSPAAVSQMVARAGNLGVSTDQ